MGTKVQSKSYLPGFYSMRDFNEDSNGCSWPLYYGDKTLTNGQYYNSFFPRAIADAYPEYDKDRLKRTMLEHEAIFHNQVSELHRLYRIQRDLMDEVKKKELQKDQVPTGPSLSSSLLASQITSEVAHKCHIPNFPVANSVCGRPSISGVEDAHSRLSSLKGSSIQAGPFLSQNGVNLKDVEVLECRPTKVRRKMFDLQLPADTYIDIEEAEEFRNDTASSFSTYLPNGNGKIEPESGGKPFRNGVGKTSCHRDGSKSDACSKGKSCLADLNEPVEIEETNGSAHSHFVRHDHYHTGHELLAKPKPELLGFPKDISVNSHRQSDNRPITNLHVENNENARGIFSHVLEAGHSNGNSKSISQSFQPQKLPVPYQQVQVLFEKAHDPPTFSLTDRSKADFSRDRMLQSFEVSGRNHEISKNSYPESNMISKVSLNLFASSDTVNPWSHSISSLEKPSSSLNQKSLSVQTHPSLNSYGPYGKSSGISPHSNESFSEKRQESSNSKLNPAFGSEISHRNGFHYGSSSGSKELGVQLLSTSYGSNVGKVVSEQFPTHGSTMPYNCPNGVDMKSAIDVNLNVVLSNNSSNMPVTQRGPQIDLRRKHEDHLPGLQWLRAKPACKNEAISARRDLNLNVGESIFFQSSSKKSTNKNETGNGFSQIFTQNVKSISSSNNADANRSEISECLHDKRILGVPIFEKHYVSENESSFTSPYVSGSQPSEGEAENKGRNMLLDINLPCDVSLDASQDNVAENSAIEKEADMKISSFGHQIDLNSCAVEDEASFILNVPSTGRKMTGGIDLEAPLIPEPEDVIHGEELSEKAHDLPLVSAESRDESLQDGPMKSAAEAIVAISSSGHCSHLDDVNCNSSETSTTDPLNWFAETVSSFGKDLDSKLEAISRDKDGGRDESSLEEIDSFESMVLRLAETKEEDYMPEPLVPENFKVEETGSTSLLTIRTRKGQGRRGRQRRDFQKDILPGLASLSRHEVTQDLQTFGGLMRATGHSWNSGLTRRNCGRGRRRSMTTSPPASATATSRTPLMQQLNNTELGLDDGSLTGWGKTTRRPRRQRCPAGNLPSLALT
ncbi:hypothetical protein Gogos_000638 [Gossypium gossypioides]|uniref:Uncharacterized protein n=1 Tax=Gossypium gossypioides TaxID=34282 RepID=A0A7J9CTU2_GOSGO|nr:hypothetical protein [Gossypium gossypioides]